MNNSPALSRYSELSQSQSQHSYHVSSEPKIQHREQEDYISPDEDEQSVSSVEGDRHDNHAVATELVVAHEALPAKANIPPKPKEPSQQLLKGTVTIPKGVKTTRVQWTSKLDEANERISKLENHINRPRS